MSFSIRRRIVVIGSAMMALCAVAPGASAQSNAAADGGWGFEGRTGASSGAHLVRRFNANWSALLGANMDFSKQDRDDPNGTSTKTYNVVGSFIVRRAWGAGTVRPFIGLGPQLSTGMTESKATNTTTNTSTSNKNTSWGIGGRGELGALVPITSALSFGILMNVNVNSLHQKSTFSGSTTENKTDILQSSIGGLQFLASVKF